MSSLQGLSIGRYHIMEQLGEGGMATVYKAYDTSLERDVAFKVIRVDMIGPAMIDQMLKRFEREAKSLAKLEHANIVHVYDYGEHDGSPYLVMQYLPGGTLKEKTGRALPFQEAARLMMPIARALEYAHRRQIIHRDVKPANILVTEDGDPMLSDFGIAKLLQAEKGMTLTGAGVGIGTPEYMAPEQWTGQSVPQTDIYALGVVLYELVTGRKPFTADTPAAVLLKQVNDPLPRPTQFAPGLPAEVEKVIFKALAKQPEARYADMGAFGQTLEKLAFTPAAAGLASSPPDSDAATMIRGEQLSEPSAAPAAVIPVTVTKAAGIPSWLFWGGGALVIAALIAVGVVFGPRFFPGETTASTAFPAPTTEDSPEGAAASTAFPTPATEYSLGKILFEDSFDDGVSSLYWDPDEIGLPWEAKEVDGRSVAYPTYSADVDWAVLRIREENNDLDFDWHDYALQYDFKFTRGDNSAGEYFFYTRMYITNCPPGVEALESYAGQIRLNLVHLSKDDCDMQQVTNEEFMQLDPDIWHTVVMSHAHKLTEVFIDGQHIVSLQDQEATIDGGGFWIETHDGVEIALDNLVIYEIVPGSEGQQPGD